MDPSLQRACNIVWEIDLVRNMGGGGGVKRRMVCRDEG